MSEKRKHSFRLIGLIEKLGPVLDQADLQLLTEAAQTALRLESGEGFNCHAVVSLRTGLPMLDCSWMGMLAQLKPEQGRSMALGILAACAEAETDAAVLTFLRDSGLADDQAAGAIVAIRNLRTRRQFRRRWPRAGAALWLGAEHAEPATSF